MAFENFPTAESNAPAPVKKSGFDWRSFLSVGLIVALLGTWGYIIWDKSKRTEEDLKKDAKFSAVLTEKDTLQNLLDEATMRYDAMKTDNAKKDSTITARDREIADKKSKIQSILRDKNATAAQLAEARNLIASLNENIESYKAEVEKLKGENLVLTQEKEEVTQQRNQARSEVDSAKSLIKQKENEIDLGSTLHASTFDILGIDDKGNGKEKETTKAKNVDKLRISFNLDENRISKSGVKDLFIAVIGPDGKPISVEAFGSGVFTTRDGEQKVFTQKVQVNYVQGEKQRVSFDWKQNSKFAIGDYKIEVYHNGFKIGEGVRHLKKGGLFG